jgi:hypothetical protein
VLGLAVPGGAEAAAPGDAALPAAGKGSSSGKEKPSKPQLYDYRVEVKKKHPKAVTLVRVSADQGFMGAQAELLPAAATQFPVLYFCGTLHTSATASAPKLAAC